MGRFHRELQAGQSQLVGHLAANAIGYCKRLLRFRKHLNIWKETVLHHPCSILLLTTCHTLSHVSPFSICRRVVHRNSSRHTLHTHKTSTRLRYTRPLLPASSSAWHAPLWALTLNPAPLFFLSFSIGLGERGDARETATDRREGGGQRGGPWDAQAEEPPALLSLPNQTRAGAAGTGLLPLWSVPTHECGFESHH